MQIPAELEYPWMLGFWIKTTASSEIGTERGVDAMTEENTRQLQRRIEKYQPEQAACSSTLLRVDDAEQEGVDGSEARCRELASVVRNAPMDGSCLQP